MAVDEKMMSEVLAKLIEECNAGNVQAMKLFYEVYRKENEAGDSKETSVEKREASSEGWRPKKFIPAKKTESKRKL